MSVTHRGITFVMVASIAVDVLQTRDWETELE